MTSISSRLYIFALLLVLSASCAAGAPQLGDLAPAIEIGHGRDGEPVQVSDYAGKVVIVSFWASWCSPCRKELPMLEALQKVADEKHLGLQVVAVNIEERDVFRKIAHKLGDMHVKLVNDRNKRSAMAYGVKGIPHMVVIGRDGHIARIHIGYGDKEIDGFLAEINELLKTA